jgi:cob(I)alamin adenosyltransferase
MPDSSKASLLTKFDGISSVTVRWLEANRACGSARVDAISDNVCVGCSGAVATCDSSRGNTRRHGRSNVELSALYSMDAASMKRVSCVPIAARRCMSIASTASAHAASPI